MPTSLTYILLSTRGCAPWRPAAVISTTSCDGIRSLGFSRAVRSASNGTAKASRFPSRWSSSPTKSLPRHPQLLKRKENSSRGSCQRRQVHLRCRLAPLAGTGILTGFPFDRSANRAVPYGIALPLRIDSPKTNCCSLGTFLHFSLQSSHLNICYYHQDLH